MIQLPRRHEVHSGRRSTRDSSENRSRAGADQIAGFGSRTRASPSDSTSGSHERAGASRSSSTRTAATAVAPMPSRNVFDVATENASWIAPTIAGTYGSTRPPGVRRHGGQQCRAKVADTGHGVEPSAGGERADRPPAEPQPRRSGRHLLGQRRRKDRPGEGEPDRPADLLEERQVARRGAELPDRDAVLDDRAGRRRTSDRRRDRSRTSTPKGRGAAYRRAGA